MTKQRPQSLLRHTALFIALVLIIAPGCGTNASVRKPERTGPSVMVQYQGKPLADCHVVLYVSTSGDFHKQWEGFSESSGVAWLERVASSDPSLPTVGSYRATLLSHGDGGWLLDARFADPQTSGIDISLIDDVAAPIELPSGAVKPL